MSVRVIFVRMAIRTKIVSRTLLVFIKFDSILITIGNLFGLHSINKELILFILFLINFDLFFYTKLFLTNTEIIG